MKRRGSSEAVSVRLENKTRPRFKKSGKEGQHVLKRRKEPRDSVSGPPLKVCVTLSEKKKPKPSTTGKAGRKRYPIFTGASFFLGGGDVFEGNCGEGG